MTATKQPQDTDRQMDSEETRPISIPGQRSAESTAETPRACVRCHTAGPTVVTDPFDGWPRCRSTAAKPATECFEKARPHCPPWCVTGHGDGLPEPSIQEGWWHYAVPISVAFPDDADGVPAVVTIKVSAWELIGEPLETPEIYMDDISMTAAQAKAFGSVMSASAITASITGDGKAAIKKEMIFEGPRWVVA